MWLREIAGRLWTFRAFEVTAILVALLAFWLDLFAREEAREVAAWQLLTTKATGNSGKKEALEYLGQARLFGCLKRRTPLVGIDLSVDAGPGAFLRGLELQGVDLTMTKFDRADLSDALLLDAYLDKTRFVGSDLSDSKFMNSTMIDTAFGTLDSVKIAASIGSIKFVGRNLVLKDIDVTRNSSLLLYNNTSSEPSTSILVENSSFIDSSVSFLRGFRLKGIEVSGSKIGGGEGWVWALARNKAEHVRGDFDYYVCDSKPSPDIIRSVDAKLYGGVLPNRGRLRSPDDDVQEFERLCRKVPLNAIPAPHTPQTRAYSDRSVLATCFGLTG